MLILFLKRSLCIAKHSNILCELWIQERPNSGKYQHFWVRLVYRACVFFQSFFLKLWGVHLVHKSVLHEYTRLYGTYECFWCMWLLMVLYYVTDFADIIGLFKQRDAWLLILDAWRRNNHNLWKLRGFDWFWIKFRTSWVSTQR